MQIIKGFVFIVIDGNSVLCVTQDIKKALPSLSS